MPCESDFNDDDDDDDDYDYDDDAELRCQLLGSAKSDVIPGHPSSLRTLDRFMQKEGINDGKQHAICLTHQAPGNIISGQQHR